ncbi:MAG: glycosyltransferase family 39 protein, partial [bacterium]
MTRCRLLIALALIVALGLRIYALGRASLWADEAFTLLVGRNSFMDIWQQTILNDYNPPLIYLLYRLWIPLIGGLPIEFGARLLPVVFDLAAIYVTARIMHERLGCDAAAMTAWLMALSPFEVEAARTARGYSLMLLLTTVCLHYADRFFAENKNRPTDGEKSHPLVGKSANYLLIAGAALVLALYTHYYAFFLFPAILALALWHRRPRLTGYFLLPIVFYIPWFPVFFHHLKKGNAMIQPLSPERFVRSILAIFAGQTFFLSQPGVSVAQMALLATLAIGLFVLVFRLIRTFRAHGESDHVANLLTQ